MTLHLYLDLEVARTSQSWVCPARPDNGSYIGLMTGFIIKKRKPQLYEDVPASNKVVYALRDHASCQYMIQGLACSEQAVIVLTCGLSP